MSNRAADLLIGGVEMLVTLGDGREAFGNAASDSSFFRTPRRLLWLRLQPPVSRTVCSAGCRPVLPRKVIDGILAHVQLAEAAGPPRRRTRNRHASARCHARRRRSGWDAAGL